ncbi:pyruvate dehydrogenase (acetyl-transferring), homodimeric type [Candidatus Profftella armatura (Diaphorina cf. continua)]|uniref:Pyruvate dehydrogenase E1 component n=1 Tax=Candidatus Profftella armatura (Diaphorina cf. continua) TaxID=2661583 RepID=A0A7R6VYN9_9PROT|nr:pyruvate dehydrogenase (acetyl-transferring), homodimeric type [Candidatus Profftella armatura (Diaphorina cf. continua)]BCG49592.1 pyruvate dehydrogenase (acetyl-transferring), homodimeric type [Candidatus Profftella armatura (Diaphorina cf. continua)]
MKETTKDSDVVETEEWISALKSVIKIEGPNRAYYLIKKMIKFLLHHGMNIPLFKNTAYINTIPNHFDYDFPGNIKIEERLQSLIRWNAMVLVIRANKIDNSLGGHLSSFASLAHILEVGFNHFWRAPTHNHGGDLIYIQGHSSPGIYARAFLEGRLTEEQMINFRQEVDGYGLSSYPHPKLMPKFWQFPTVSMGLGPLTAIHQARFLKYLHARKITNTINRKIWIFCGDGEMDEPESMSELSMAAREKLDNLIMIVNCNLQRLDGPVRGNSKIIQELEAHFYGVGWHVIKVIWSSSWDKLLECDHNGILKKIMMDTLDGEYQNYRSKNSDFIRKNFFGKHPELLEMIKEMSDEDIWNLTFGGHDLRKIYSAFKMAQKNKDKPTVLLIKSIKGYGLGEFGEARNIAHNVKKVDNQGIKSIRDFFKLPIPDSELSLVPFYKPSINSPEIQYLKNCRKKLGGYLPKRRQKSDEKLLIPPLEAFKKILEPTLNERKISTTYAYVRILNTILRDKNIGNRVVPIVVDESRTFGMEGLFRQIGIFSQVGQLYDPVDKGQVMYYREEKNGQILQEGINEAGGMGSWIAAATAYSTSNCIMIPFFIFYSMFGFQRIGDLAWLAGDIRARGFLIGGTSGRTTINGEGLQHEDGHSHILASTIPNCIPYDPTFAHEVAVIIHHGLHCMISNQEDVFYYITVMNENYSHPGLKKGQEKGILKGLYLLKKHNHEKSKLKVQLIGSGAILREILAAQILLQEWDIDSAIWSATSFTLLARDGQETTRWNMLHPTKKQKIAYITKSLEKSNGPIIVATDYMRLFAEQIRAFIPKGRIYKVLGTDGFGCSDTRKKLRNFFEVSRYYIAIAALNSLAKENLIKFSIVSEAIKKYNINTEKQSPFSI